MPKAKGYRALALSLRNPGNSYTKNRRMGLTMLSLPKPQLVNTPLLALGTERDACFSKDEIRETARAYGTEAVFFPDMGHNMMLEPGWQAVAETIDGAH